jgi:taurine dioxygenase
VSFSTMQPGPRPYLDKRQSLLEDLRWDRITARRLSPVLGAEIGGIDLSKPLDDQTLAELRKAHLHYRVLVFRDQEISREQHLSFARLFGELEEHPFIPAPDGAPEVAEFEKGEEVPGVENIWHSDVSWREIPSLGSILRAREVPEVGGDTLFADMVAAYECLDKATKEQIEGMKAVHDFTNTFGIFLKPDELAEKQKEFPAVEHPVVRTNAETGERSLYVNTVFTSGFVGLDGEEASELMEKLLHQSWIPEFQCRLRWEKDTLVFWDNRMVQHYAANDYWPRRRVMERATIIGERPV